MFLIGVSMITSRIPWNIKVIVQHPEQFGKKQRQILNSQAYCRGKRQKAGLLELQLLHKNCLTDTGWYWYWSHMMRSPYSCSCSFSYCTRLHVTRSPLQRRQRAAQRRCIRNAEAVGTEKRLCMKSTVLTAVFAEVSFLSALRISRF